MKKLLRTDNKYSNHARLILVACTIAFASYAQSEQFVLNASDAGYIGVLQNGAINGPYPTNPPNIVGPDAGRYDPSLYQDPAWAADSQGIYEFSLATISGAGISSATFSFDVNDISKTPYSSCFNFSTGCPIPTNLNLYSYAADGKVTASDYNAGAFLTSYDPTKIINSRVTLDVTSLIDSMLVADASYVGFNFRTSSPGDVFLPNGVLTVTTVPTPGAFVLFISSIVGAGLRRHKNLWPAICQSEVKWAASQ